MMLIAILITQTLVFIVSSYLITGDAFLALKNFYSINYNIEVVCMKKLILISIAFAFAVSLVFLFMNPVLFTTIDEEFSEGEVFTPVNGQYDFRLFKLNSTETQNFTAGRVKSGHVQLGADGDYIINVVEMDEMFDLNRYITASTLSSEEQKPSVTVDGVVIHVVEMYGKVYYASFINRTDYRLLISTPSENETVLMVKSIEFL